MPCLCHSCSSRSACLLLSFLNHLILFNLYPEKKFFVRRDLIKLLYYDGAKKGRRDGYFTLHFQTLIVHRQTDVQVYLRQFIDIDTFMKKRERARHEEREKNKLLIVTLSQSTKFFLLLLWVSVVHWKKPEISDSVYLGRVDSFGNLYKIHVLSLSKLFFIQIAFWQTSTNPFCEQLNFVNSGEIIQREEKLFVYLVDSLFLLVKHTII